MDRFRIALAQINPVQGDPKTNADLILKARQQAGDVDLVICPELALSHYMIGDLLAHPSYQNDVACELRRLASETRDGGPALLIGSPIITKDGCFNAAVCLDEGEIQTWRGKHHLPNYDVFDDKRYFQAAALPGPITVRGLRLGVMICEDMWNRDVSECLFETGAEILVTLSASVFEVGKQERRLQAMISRVVETGLPHIFVNFIGGCDDIVFDGGSMIIGADHSLRGNLPEFRSGLLITNWTRSQSDGWICDLTSLHPEMDACTQCYEAAVLGVRDFVSRCAGSQGKVVLGMSGGLDSALCAAIAVDALGSDRVQGVRLPSPWSSEGSLNDAADCASRLKIELCDVPIAPGMSALNTMLTDGLKKTEFGDLTLQNIQARLRGIALMAIANETGALLLSTGNKSEIAVGYATLYGDMCGAYNPLKDMYKTTVQKLATWRRDHYTDLFLGPKGKVIPQAILNKPPSAELKPNQRDTDSLPPYEVLDAILQKMIEGNETSAMIVAAGYDEKVVHQIRNLVFGSEFKRRQSCPGPKLTSRDFGLGRRHAIMSQYRP